MSPRSNRLPFEEMPAVVRGAIDDRLGGRVVATTNATGGFSAGPACRTELADGRVVFVKAYSSALNQLTVDMHRREADVLAALPVSFPAPALLGTVEAGDWFALITEHIDGVMPAAPYNDDEIERILGLVAAVAQAGSPSPLDFVARVGDLEQERGNRWAWRAILDQGLAERLDGWSARHLGALIELEDSWIDAAHGESLVHRDLRPDNMLLAPGAGVAVDWPTASRGAPWIDLVGLLPNFCADTGHDPEQVFLGHPVGRRAEPAAVTTYLASLAGYFSHQELLPAPTGIRSGIREFQARQGAVARAWLRTRVGWE